MIKVKYFIDIEIYDVYMIKQFYCCYDKIFQKKNLMLDIMILIVFKMLVNNIWIWCKY